MPLTVAIVGRPNVGKSTLFNRLVGRRLAIVHDTPGVTRDRQEAEAQLGNLAFHLIDTAGFEESARGSLAARMTEQTQTAIAEADVCLFVIDGREGVTAGDEIIATALRRANKPVILAANKCESRASIPGQAEAYALGFGEPLAVSAEHNLGFDELKDALEPFVPEDERVIPGDEDSDESDDGEELNEDEEIEVDRSSLPLRLAIVGRPNVGKSSLFNRLLGEERSLTGPEAGITRDAIVAEWKAGARPILLHDTAGLRKKAKARVEALENMSVGSTLAAIRFAECVIVVMDATMAFEKQDLTIADLIAREGRAIVFALNKWDLITDHTQTIASMREKLDRLLPQVAGAPLVAVSARTGEGLDRLVPAIIEADTAWNKRIPTGQLNRFLEDALQRHPPPAIHGRRVRIRYMTQAKSRPPTFALFGNQLDALPESYQRYLQNGLRESFGLKGVPLRFALRTAKNPYAGG
ncbi:MAG: ribosome biogenesis GTPase Der [Alphaproteobacteria bacterium]|nr:ribosome biogenesis GTPase Der [Alphaproteobacteria bacterium]